MTERTPRRRTSSRPTEATPPTGPNAPIAAAKPRRASARAAAPRAEAPTEDAPRRLKMQHLVQRTGVPRQVIHFYIQQGLVPEGTKTGRNMAYYDESHVERVALVRKLQHERFLPLKVIKAMLDQTDEAFSPTQKRLFAEVKAHLSSASGLVSDDGLVDVDALAKARNLAPADLEDLEKAGYVVLGKRPGADARSRRATPGSSTCGASFEPPASRRIWASPHEI
ncbi:MAG: MerR family transcriptional regulator [Myxococcales bacterium]|nr:MerR family transcriptional regulator [Myxococcales bacterium]